MDKKQIKKIRKKALKDIVKRALATVNGEDNLTNAEQIYGQVLINEAMNGNMKAIEMLVKISGEDEPQKVEVSANVGISHKEAIQLIKEQMED